MPYYEPQIPFNFPKGEEIQNLWSEIISPSEPGEGYIGSNIDWVNLAKALMETSQFFSQPGTEFMQPLGMISGASKNIPPNILKLVRWAKSSSGKLKPTLPMDIVFRYGEKARKWLEILEESAKLTGKTLK